MAAIIEWEKDLKKKDYCELKDIQIGLKKLKNWKLFEKEHPHIKILRIMTDREIKEKEKCQP